MKRKRDFASEAVLAIELDNFTFEDLRQKLNKDYPETVFKNALLYATLVSLRKKGMISVVPGKGRTKSTHKVLVKAQALGDDGVDAGKDGSSATNKEVVNMAMPDLRVITQVARAVIEYPGDTFTKMDIFNFLRSKESTLHVNDLTVFDYVGRTLINRRIVEPAGKNKKTKLYKRGKCIIERRDFTPQEIESLLSDNQSDVVEVSSAKTLNQPASYQDLEISAEDLGERIHLYMNNLRSKLEASIADREELIGDQAEKMGLIDGLRKELDECSASRELVIERDKEISDARSALAQINPSMSEAPLSALVHRAIEIISLLQPLTGINERYINLSKRFEVLEASNKKLAKERSDLADLLRKSQEEVSQLKGKKGKMLVLKSFSELGVGVKGKTS